MPLKKLDQCDDIWWQHDDHSKVIYLGRNLVGGVSRLMQQLAHVCPNMVSILMRRISEVRLLHHLDEA